MNCIRHPDRPAFSVCMKYNQGYCQECCACVDPKGHCKFRTRCIAWQINDRLKAETAKMRNDLSALHNQVADLNVQLSSLTDQNQNLQREVDGLKDQLKGRRKKP